MGVARYALVVYGPTLQAAYAVMMAGAAEPTTTTAVTVQEVDVEG